MPTKRIPDPIIARLRRAAHRLSLDKMQNVDHRKHQFRILRSSYEWGGRVRELNVKRNAPFRIVIKRAHGYPTQPAQQTISDIQARVNRYNQCKIPNQLKSIRFKLLMPHADAISDNLIAMSRLPMPTVREILEKDSPRGRSIVKSWEKKGWDFKKMMKEIDAIYRYIHKKTGIQSSNLFLVKANPKKYEFVPALDSL